MLSRPLFRFVRDDRRINFMRGRHMGLIVSAVLSIASVILFFQPGLKLGLDFRGGIIVEAQTPALPISASCAQHSTMPAFIRMPCRPSDRHVMCVSRSMLRKGGS